MKNRAIVACEERSQSLYYRRKRGKGQKTDGVRIFWQQAQVMEHLAMLGPQRLAPIYDACRQTIPYDNCTCCWL